MTKVAIVTRNAMHGGVETMIALHQKCFHATVIATGGIESPETCPFPYVYLDASDTLAAEMRLAQLLTDYDVVIYHWLPSWAVEAIYTSGKPCIEVVHREDTNECDKTVPSLIVTHSQFLADAIRRACGREAIVIPHGVDVSRFPEAERGAYIGGITSYYYPVKGLDIFFKAWRHLEARFPDERVRFYGAGHSLSDYERMVTDLGLRNVELLGPVALPESRIAEFRLIVHPSRIEGMPFSVLEALASNVPVICSDLPGMAEFNRVACERGATAPLVLFRSEDVDDLTEKIAGQLAARAPTQTREYVRQYYSAESHCRKYERVIERALAMQGQQRGIGLMRALRARLKDSEVELRALHAQVAELGDALRELERAQHAIRERLASEQGQALETVARRLDERERALEALSKELTTIKNSRGWKWLERYRRMRSTVQRAWRT